MPRFQIHAYILVVLFLGGAVAVGLSRNETAGKRITEDFSGIPARIGDWNGSNGTFQDARNVYDQLSTCSLLTRAYIHPTETPVQLDIVLGLDLGDFHQPEVCMGGAGWALVTQKQVTVHPQGMPEHQAVLNMMRNATGGEIMLLYWFYMAGKVTPTLNSRFQQMIDNTFREPQPAAMVKFTAMIDETPEKSAKAVTDLAEQLEKPIVEVCRKTPKFEDSQKILDSLPEE